MTEQDDTVADAEAEPETTVVASETSTSAGHVQAWSLDDDTTVEPDNNRRPLPRALVILLAGVLVGGAALAAYLVDQEEHGSHLRPLAPTHVPATATKSPAVAPTPKPAYDLRSQLDNVPNVGVQDIDSRYLAVLGRRGVT
jgi:hypothetical protein